MIRRTFAALVETLALLGGWLAPMHHTDPTASAGREDDRTLVLYCDNQ